MKISKKNKNSTIILSLLLAVLFLFAFSHNAFSTNSDPFILKKNNFKIVFSNEESGALKLAVDALRKDFVSVMGFKPEIIDKIGSDNSQLEIVIINRSSGKTKFPAKTAKSLDGFESHRIYADAKNNRIYIEGYDLRGTIFAIYTFCEEILGVPPLKYWSTWLPDKKDEIPVAKNMNICFKSPQVRYRSILPGDQDFFDPWKNESKDNQNIWLETTLRLKLNTVECYSTIKPGYKLSDYAYLIDKYGLVITSHHIAALNTSFSTWDSYWENERKMTPPELLLSNEKEIIDFFRYNAETVVKNGIENLWTVAFRGKVDQPFWSVFKDAPESDKDRAEVINRMLQIQLDIIKEKTGNPNPYVRITFYDELATLMAKGYLKPPVGENMIWTYVAARRDPYPYQDLVNFSSEKPVKLGFYMNFGFASTGAHVAPAEGPWKMEFNYRYVNNKSPLYFSVVNVGNFREFVLELSANAKMLWDYKSYNTDQFMLEYCKQYFGQEHANEIAQLYKDFYNSYWQPKEAVFEGMERQFLFQDLRYARAFDQMYDVYYSSKENVNMNPLKKIGYESEIGRTFRIDFEYNNSKNEVDAMLYGMEKTIPKFESVATRCSNLMPKLDKEKQTFFNDNLRVYSYYMTNLSKTLYHYVYAYKNQRNRAVLIENLDLAKAYAIQAKEILNESEHGFFPTWYSNAELMPRTFQIDSLIKNIDNLKSRAKN